MTLQSNNPFRLKSGTTLLALLFAVGAAALSSPLVLAGPSPEEVFRNPPPEARPGVMWMWMGSNNSKEAITRDLEALHGAGYGRTLMFSLADVTTPWAHPIGKSPTPEIVAWTKPWWALVRHAALESKRLGMEFGMFNGPGYETSGGPWITPELTMQEVCFSQATVAGGSRVRVKLDRPAVDPRSVQLFPVYDPATGTVGKPEIPARRTYFKDIAVLAMPAEGVVAKDQILDLSAKLGADGELAWDAPAGQWTIYRFGHTTMGTLMQPAQWAANGFECDKMNPDAVAFHVKHVIAEIRANLGDLIGTGIHSVHVDSYEAGKPSWTPRMREEFAARRGYALTPFLPTFAQRVVGSDAETGKFRADFEATIKDLYRDVHFAVTSRLLREAGLVFSCEPYGGPWRQSEIMPHVQTVMTEFWTNGGKFHPFQIGPTVAALRKSGQNIVEAEAFTGQPEDSLWSETPAWLKPMGDEAFCAGVNRFILHRYVPQPWDDRYKPGNTMGRWGTHFDRTQTWWEPGKAMVRYWTRCQALLQWGAPAGARANFSATGDGVSLKSIHRRGADANVFFVANTARTGGEAWCSFKVAGRQPEWWDAVTGTMRDLPQFEERDGRTVIPMRFAPTESCFVVFRKKIAPKSGGNFPVATPVTELSGAWDVAFDPQWGGPAAPVKFDTLADWTQRAEPGIKYFSGTAAYRKTFDAPDVAATQLSLGTVNAIARVRLNGRDLGVAWCAPWSVSVPPGVLRAAGNQLEIEVTNTWANRLIGDEQEPPDCEWLPGHLPGGKFLKEFPDWFLKKQPRPSRGRYCFTTWNYFTKDSPLLPSGLLGQVRLMREDWTALPAFALPALTSTNLSGASRTLSPAGAPVLITGASDAGDAAAFEDDVPKNNLLAKAAIADTGAGRDSGATDAEPLRNGTTLNGSGEGGTLNDGKTYRAYAEGGTFTARLDTTGAPRGYDLASVVTFAGHPDGRASQHFDVQIARADAPENFVPIATAKFDVREVSSKVTLASATAAPLATGVVAIRLQFHDGPIGANVYREICVLGAPEKER